MVNEQSKFGGFLTDIGDAKQANANALRIPWNITHMLLGDANGNDPVPDPKQTRLVNQVYRAPVNQLSVDPDNPGILIAELVLPPNVGGWWIRELGLEDEGGDFVAVANCAPSYKPLLAQGSGRNQVVRMHLILSNTANVQLKIDPSIVLATRQYVDQSVEAHAKSRAHPDADTKNKGMLRFATLAESKKGEEAKAAQTPAGGMAQLNDHRAEKGAHDAGQIGLVEALEKFGGADTVQAVLAMLGSAALKDAGDAPLLTLADFTSGQNLGPRGVQPLPGGLILQWVELEITGSIRTYSNSTITMHDDGDTFSLPIPFPERCLAWCGNWADAAESIIENMTLSAGRTSIFARACGLSNRTAGTTYTMKGTAFFLGK